MAQASADEDQGWADRDLDDFGEYCFETDQLTLKGNNDYHNLLKTLVVLQGQRMIAVQNMEKLMTLKDEALKSPLVFVEKLQSGEKLDFPSPQVVAQIPDINWAKYGISIPQGLAPSAPTSSANNSDSETGKDGEKGKDGKLLVRGREFNQKKPETFNQLWTPEEQKRLEELLTTFPPEQIEMERFRKIAKALGNRTPLQVQSRVQKYFIKLQKAGLPVPGRTYNFTHYSNNRRSGHRHQRNNRFLFQPSTFFASATPPVFMNDMDDCDPGLPGHEMSPAEVIETIQVSDEETESSQSNEDYQELMWLKLVQKVRSKQKTLSSVTHHGYKCDNCQTEPISGPRWNCHQCSNGETSFDLCDRCVYLSTNKLGCHRPNHKLSPIIKNDSQRHAATYLQTNFMSDMIN